MSHSPPPPPRGAETWNSRGERRCYVCREREREVRCLDAGCCFCFEFFSYFSGRWGRWRVGAEVVVYSVAVLGFWVAVNAARCGWRVTGRAAVKGNIYRCEACLSEVGLRERELEREDWKRRMDLSSYFIREVRVDWLWNRFSLSRCMYRSKRLLW